MACFTAAIAEVALVGIIKRKVAQKEQTAGISADKGVKIPLSTKLSWLITMLWGGVFLLAIEHIYHGEIIAEFPFLTAVRDGNTSEMLMEIATIGGGICVLIPLVWLIACKIADKKLAQSVKTQCA